MCDGLNSRERRNAHAAATLAHSAQCSWFRLLITQEEVCFLGHQREVNRQLYNLPSIHIPRAPKDAAASSLIHQTQERRETGALEGCGDTPSSRHSEVRSAMWPPPAGHKWQTQSGFWIRRSSKPTYTPTLTIVTVVETQGRTKASNPFVPCILFSTGFHQILKLII